MAGSVGSSTPAVSREEAKRAGFTLVDQALVSGTSFIIGVALARALRSEEYGGYVIAMSIFNLVFSLEAALVSGPIPFVSAGLSSSDRSSYLAGLLRIFRFLVPAILLFFVIAYWLAPAFSMGQGRLSLLLPWVGFALSAYVVQDFFRKVLLSGLEVRRLLLVDLSSTVFQLSLLGLFMWTGGGSIHEGRAGYVSPETTFLSIGFGSICGSVVGFAFERIPWNGTSAQTRQASRQNWDFGRWSLSSVIVTYLGTQSMVFVIGAVEGLSGAASYEAARLISGPVQLAIFGIAGLAGVRAAAICSQRGCRPALGYVDRMTGIGLACFLCYYGVVYISFPFIMGATVGQKFLGEKLAVFLFGICYLLLWVSSLQGALLSAMMRPQKNFKAYVIGTSCTIASAFGLVLLLQSDGAIAAMVVGTLATVVTQRITISRELRTQPAGRLVQDFEGS